MSKSTKFSSEEVEDVKETLMKFVVQKKSLIAESDHNSCTYQNIILKNLKADEVLRYRQEVLGKDE